MNLRGMVLLAGLGVGTSGWLDAQTAGTALVRHAPVLNGNVEGSVQQMLGESVTLNGGASVAGDLLVPGTPAIRLNGRPHYDGTCDGSGSPTPTGYQVTLNGNATLRSVIRRTDPVAIPTVDPPPPPAGTRNVVLNRSGQDPGDFATVRNLTINGNAGSIAVPPGCYGDLVVNGAGSLVLGRVGAKTVSVYSLQRLTLNGTARLEVLGPVELSMATGVAFNGRVGSAGHSSWLQLNVADGGVTLNGGATLWGTVRAPRGSVIINGNSRLEGALTCDRLVVNGNGLLRLVVSNQPPAVAMSAPADGSTLTAFNAVTLAAVATDSDGAVVKVEFFNGQTSLGCGSPVSGGDGEYALSLLGGLPVGCYAFSATATDDQGATTASAPASVTVTLSPNVAPRVTVVAPEEGASLVARSAVTLVASAVDPDGAIAAVDFFDGLSRLGAGTAVAGEPGAYSMVASLGAAGIHQLMARATDNAGASTDSAPVAVTVMASLPYRADFEPAEGYVAGSLAEQLGWRVAAGIATITDADHYSGERSVVLLPGTPPARIGQTLALAAGQGLVFVDVLARPAAAADIGAASTFAVAGVRLGLVGNAGGGQLQALDGGGAGGRWQPSDFVAPLEVDGTTQNWIRLTARLDLERSRWDLYADGALVAFDLKMADESVAGVLPIEIQGHAAAPTRFDDLYVGLDNPLFADADRDGMDDAWEVANGLNPNVDDRGGDLDGDGLSNIREYLLKLKPNNPDTDGDGLFDGDEVVWGWGPSTPNPDTVPPSAPTDLMASATTDTVSLSWQPASDNLRVSGYVVYRNGQPIDTAQPIRGTRYADANLPDNESFGYEVRAFDFAGNLSPPSEHVIVRTLATDSDGNGLPDFWERKYFPKGGVDPNADEDGDGLTNLEEYRAGSDPRDFYNGVLPTHEVLYGGRPGPEDQLAMIVRKPDGSPWPNAPVDFNITSGRRRITSAPGGPYGFHVTVRADSTGRAQCYLEPLTP